MADHPKPRLRWDRGLQLWSCLGQARVGFGSTMKGAFLNLMRAELYDATRKQEAEIQAFVRAQQAPKLSFVDRVLGGRL